MSKIHAIKCPQCGSPEKKEVKENFYKCESCGTEYFLESNDVKHFHFHRSEQDGAKPDYLKWGKIAIIASVFFILLSYQLLSLSKQQQRVTNSRQTAQQNRTNTSVTKVPEKPKERLELSYRSRFAFNKNQEPVFIGVGHQRIDYQIKDESVFDIVFYNAKTGKSSSIKQIKKQAPGTSSDMKIERFRTGEIYAIDSGRAAYFVDLESEQFVPMNEEFERRHQTLSKGIATIEKSRRYGDGFNIMLVDGKKVLYFPHTNYLTTDDEAFDYIYRSNGKVANNAVLHTMVDFSSRGKDRPIDMNTNDKIKLVEYQTKTAEGYPFIQPSFYDLMKKDKKGVENFLSKESIIETRITKWRDVTPERDYYLPDLHCTNKQYALISFNQSILSDSIRFFQLLDVNTGNPIWTKELKPKQNIGDCAIDNSGISYMFESSAKRKIYRINLQGDVSGEKIWE